MNVPSIPTDSLYKFCAVTGVVLFLFGATFPVQKVFETQNDLDRADTEIAILGVQTSALQEEIKRLESEAESLQSDIDAAEAKPHAADVVALRARSATTKTSLEVASKENYELTIASVKQKGGWDHLQHLIQRMWLCIIGAAVFMVGGYALARFGFKHWYYRVQKPLDELLKRQAGDTES